MLVRISVVQTVVVALAMVVIVLLLYLISVRLFWDLVQSVMTTLGRWIS